MKKKGLIITRGPINEINFVLYDKGDKGISNFYEKYHLLHWQNIKYSTIRMQHD